MPSIGYTIDKNQVHAIAGLILLMIVSYFTIFGRFGRAHIPNVNSTDALITATDSYVLTTESENIVLNENLLKCLSEHSKFHYLSSLEGRNLVNAESYDESSEIQNETININQSLCTSIPPGLCIYYLLIDFTKCLKPFGVKLELIEPDVLFCLLPSVKRYNLLTRGFQPAKVTGLKNVITFGISDKHAEIFNQGSSRLKIIKSGFRIWRFPKLMKSRSKSHIPRETLQFIVKKNNIFIRLIVFYEQNSYLWHPGLNASELCLQNMLYCEDGAYDKFETSPLDLDITSTAQVFLPSDSRFYLLALQNSEFLKCNNSLTSSSVMDQTLKDNVIEAMKEIKNIFQRYMVNFWLWGKTLRGWYDSCNVLRYSPDLELAVTLKGIEGYNFTGLFADSTCQEVKVDFNLSSDVNVEMKCQSINIKISVMHEERNISWYTYSNGQNSYRQSFLFSDVCSGDIWGLRVNVPCDTHKIFQHGL